MRDRYMRDVRRGRPAKDNAAINNAIADKIRREIAEREKTTQPAPVSIAPRGKP